jgi:hypothetical protein
MVAEVPPVPAPQTIHAGCGCGSRASCSMIDSAMLLLPRQSVARSARPNWSRKQAPLVGDLACPGLRADAGFSQLAATAE